MNKFLLIGNVGKDPEVITTNSGKKVAKFSLAETFGKETQWRNIVCWEKTAEIVEQYVKKGMKIGIDGRVTYRTYEDKDGNKRQITEVVAKEIELLGSKPAESSQETTSQETQQPPVQDSGVADDGLPF